MADHDDEQREARDWLRDRRDTGATVPELASELGLSVGSVLRCLAGIHVRRGTLAVLLAAARRGVVGADALRDLDQR